MSDFTSNLGVCFFADRLFYALNDPQNSKHLFRIGSFDFNFDVNKAITLRDETHFPILQNIFDKLFTDHKIQSVRALTHPGEECWTALPKVVYDNPDEREDHLSILMKGVERHDIEPTWHTLSKNGFKFLCLRRRAVMQGFNDLTTKIAITDFASDFEIARKWSAFSKPGGSFLMIGCHKNILTITSFLLGKFRAATYLRFDDISDVPYHWLQQATNATWMNGLHENIFLFGHHTHETEQSMQSFWDPASNITHLNSLEKIGVVADEQTYGFDLAAAFPAILLSLDF